MPKGWLESLAFFVEGQGMGDLGDVIGTDPMKVADAFTEGQGTDGVPDADKN